MCLQTDCGRKPAPFIVCQVHPGCALGYQHTRHPGELVNVHREKKKPRASHQQSSGSVSRHRDCMKKPFLAAEPQLNSGAGFPTALVRLLCAGW